jgi:AcrR family transcriptional regulator
VIHENAVTVDGRNERTVRTRQNILSATRELILEDVLDPTAREVADVAGITTRTLFRHFPDMESLHRSLIDDAEASAARVMDEPFPEGTRDQWPELLRVIIDRRVRVYESLLPLYVSPIWIRYRTARSGSGKLQGVRRRRERLRSVLPEAISGESTLFEAIDGVLSIDYWVGLRRSQRLSVVAATRVVRLAVQSLTNRQLQ